MRQNLWSKLPTNYGGWFIEAGYREVIVPAICPVEVFQEKVGAELVNQMWTFQDKGGRPTCLIPEVTGIFQKLYREKWSKERAKPVRVFYLSRCYRYERPQAGRYREFWQFGIENLSEEPSKYYNEVTELLQKCLSNCGINYEWRGQAKRGLNYYVGDGFEASVPDLGAQAQIAGGGAYPEGIGWAIGVDRVVMASMQTKKVIK